MCGITAMLDLRPGDGARPTSPKHEAEEEEVDPTLITAAADTTAAAAAAAATAAERDELQQQIERSLDAVQYRGPDARGAWIKPDARVGLGHVRLSVIDLSPEGDQPFHDAANDVHAVVNGELYDFETLREQLAPSFAFKGRSDCELVLALYQHYGLAFVHYLHGEYALVLYDARRELLVAVRDRYGVRSLYYTVHEGRLLIATEMKSFLAYGWKPQWDVQALRDCGWRCDRRNIFKGVRKLLPGQYLVCSNFGDVEVKRYWDLDYPDKRVKETRSEAEMIQGVRTRLVDAIRRRLRADVPVGIYLSGGLDSSAVAGIITHLMKDEKVKLGCGTNPKLKCFCVQFPADSGVDESDVAKRTAEWLGVDLELVYVDEDVIASKLEDAMWYSETPCPDVNGPAKLAMAEVVHSQGIKVILTGEGSDEHFGGYAYFAQDFVREPDMSWTELFSPQQSPRALPNSGAHAYEMMGTTTRAGPPLSTHRMLNGTIMARLHTTVGAIPFARWTDRFAATDPETTFAESFDAQTIAKVMTKWHPLNTAAYIHTKTIFQMFLLRYVGENMDMAHAVESRTPFLDHHLTEYANAIPPALKLKADPATKRFRDKSILRDAVRPFVTDEIFRRRKAPFFGPARYATHGPVHRVFTRLVTPDTIRALGFIEWAQVKGLVEKAFVDHDPAAFRTVLTVAQLVTLSQRFGVPPAAPPPTPTYRSMNHATKRKVDDLNAPDAKRARVTA